MRWQVDWSVVTDMTRPIRAFLVDLAEDADRANGVVRDLELKEWIEDLGKSARELEENIRTMSKDQR